MTDTLLALSTENCRIAPLHADDARALASITDETVTSQVHFLPTPFTEADARALIAGSGWRHMPRRVQMRETAGKSSSAASRPL